MRFSSFLGYIAFGSFPLQQAFNATAVVRHMRRLQLGTSHEGPNPTLPSPCRTHLLLPEEDAGTVGKHLATEEGGNVWIADFFIYSGTYLLPLMTNSTDGMSPLSLPEACCEGGCSQNVDGGADALSNCTYRCHPTSRV